MVKLRLVENDYAILRSYEGRSSFATFIGVVVQRMALDYRIHEWGRWRASAEAKRLGPLAVDLEELLYRDGRTLADALTLLREKHEGVSYASLEALAAKLPPRTPRRRDIPLEDADEPSLAQPSDVDEPILMDERRREAQKLSQAIAPILARLSEQDRLILHFHFVRGMTFAQIARAFGLHEKLTYRRIEQIRKELKRELEKAGFQWNDIAGLIGHDEAFLHFDIGNPNAGPSIPGDEKTGPHTEEP